jgi:hypothetical protein
MDGENVEDVYKGLLGIEDDEKEYASDFGWLVCD